MTRKRWCGGEIGGSSKMRTYRAFQEEEEKRGIEKKQIKAAAFEGRLHTSVLNIQKAKKGATIIHAGAKTPIIGTAEIRTEQGQSISVAVLQVGKNKFSVVPVARILKRNLTVNRDIQLAQEEKNAARKAFGVHS